MDALSTAERLRQQALEGLRLLQPAEAEATDRTLSAQNPKGRNDATLTMPEGWEDAVEIWVRAGCPKGDPIMLGLNLAALQRLAQLPREQRVSALREWRRQVREREQMWKESL